MPNSYFKFKQFTINQDQCAMKVGTDGVLLGAWADCSETKRVLDVGTGTGLIALMIAQRSTAKIDAIEIDQYAAAQAKENCIKSPWKERINIYPVSFQDFVTSNASKYDLIVCNPPYFANALHTPDESRTIARHNTKLKLEDLFSGAKKILKNQGNLSIIIPADNYTTAIDLAQNHLLYPQKKLWLKPNENKKPVRAIIQFSKDKTASEKENTLTIEKSKRHDYTDEYKALTKDFYLIF